MTDSPSNGGVGENDPRDAEDKRVAIATAKRRVQWYGWKPDLPDHNDLIFRPSLVLAAAGALPIRTNNYLLNALRIPRYDQDALGACTANAALRGHRIAIRRTPGGLHDFDGSRLAHYYWTRELDGSEGYDSGAYIRDAIKVLNKIGVAPEKDWPYDIHRFAVRPPPAVLEAAKRRIRIRYERVTQRDDFIKAALAERHPVEFGCSVFASGEGALERGGIVPMPGRGDPVIGGHAMLLEDYDTATLDFPFALAANSWGEDSGIGADGKYLPAIEKDKLHRAGYRLELLGGYVIVPLDYLTDAEISDDFWAIMAAA